MAQQAQPLLARVRARVLVLVRVVVRLLLVLRVLVLVRLLVVLRLRLHLRPASSRAASAASCASSSFFLLAAATRCLAARTSGSSSNEASVAACSISASRAVNRTLPSPSARTVTSACFTFRPEYVGASPNRPASAVVCVTVPSAFRTYAPDGRLFAAALAPLPPFIGAPAAVPARLLRLLSPRARPRPRPRPRSVSRAASAAAAAAAADAARPRDAPRPRPRPRADAGAGAASAGAGFDAAAAAAAAAREDDRTLEPQPKSVTCKRSTRRVSHPCDAPRAGTSTHHPLFRIVASGLRAS